MEAHNVLQGNFMYYLTQHLVKLLYSPVTVTISQTFLNDVKEYLNCMQLPLNNL